MSGSSTHPLTSDRFDYVSTSSEEVSEPAVDAEALIGRASPVVQKSGDSVPARHPLSSGLLWHLRWTVPVHALLPIGLCWLLRYAPETAASAFWGVHLGFPVILLATVRWWWNQPGDLIALLFINHMVTFAVLVFLPWYSLL